LYIWRHIKNDRKARAAAEASAASGPTPANMPPSWQQQSSAPQQQWGQQSQPFVQPQQQQSWQQQPQSPQLPFPQEQNGQNGWNTPVPPSVPSQFHSQWGAPGTSVQQPPQQNWYQPAPSQWGQPQPPHQQGWPPQTD